MKGKLINKDQKWIVQYEEVDNTSFGIAAAIGGAIIPSVKELPLHPDDVYSSSLVIGEKGEVEFEIIEVHCAQIGFENVKFNHISQKFAKLITRQEESSNWDEIFDEFAQFGKGKIGDWLKENFKIPERI